MSFVEQKQSSQMLEERMNETDEKTHRLTVNMMRIKKIFAIATISFKCEQEKKGENVSMFLSERARVCVHGTSSKVLK